MSVSPVQNVSPVLARIVVEIVILSFIIVLSSLFNKCFDERVAVKKSFLSSYNALCVLYWWRLRYTYLISTNEFVRAVSICKVYKLLHFLFTKYVVNLLMINLKKYNKREKNFGTILLIIINYFVLFLS